MSTRTTNSWRHTAWSRRAALSVVGAFALAASGAKRSPLPTRAASRTRATTKRPSEPEKTLPPILQKALEEKEAQITDARREAIRLIEAYLRENPRGRRLPRQGAGRSALQAGRALLGGVEGGLPREDGRAIRPRCRPATTDRAECPKVPHRPPTIDLTRAQATYLRLIGQYPKFRKIDTVIYLYAFSLRDQGKLGESIKYFQIILDKYPRSRYIADAWMAIAEYRFYEQQDYKSSLEAYEKVLKHPKSHALRPGAVQDRLVLLEAGRHRPGGAAVQGRARSGQEEGRSQRGAAEARRGAARPGARLPGRAVHGGRHQDRPDAFEFLAQIGGKQYSRKVLRRLADTVFDQTRYERAVEAYRLLIDAGSQRRGRPRLRAADRGVGISCWATPRPPSRRCAGWPATTAPRSAWANANKDRPKAVEHARTMAEGLIRNLAKTMHGEAQRPRRRPRWSTRIATRAPPRPTQFYLANFPDAPDAAELRYLRADILYFKLGKYEDAGREYLAVGKTQPVGKYHKDALLQAMGAFEKVRKPIPATARRGQARDHRQRSPVRRGGRPLRHAVPQRQGDRHRHLQERSVLLRLRRL